MRIIIRCLIFIFTDSPVPMSQRNLPPSFWICDYYQQHSQHLQQQQQQQQHQQQYDPYDAYMQAADPWHNYMYHQHQRDVYSQASRQYSSLLHLQRSALQQQQGRQVAAALGKAPNDSWATAAAAGAAVEGFASASTHAHYPVTGKLTNYSLYYLYFVENIVKLVLTRRF